MIKPIQILRSIGMPTCIFGLLVSWVNIRLNENSIIDYVVFTICSLFLFIFWSNIIPKAGKEYLIKVKNKREGDKVKQEFLFHIGSVEEIKKVVCNNG